MDGFMGLRTLIDGHQRQGTAILKWSLLAIPTSFLIGSACALFLWLLDIATRTQWNHPWLLYLLPLLGVVVVKTYDTIGSNSERGNNLLIDEIHEPGGGVPLRMAPLILGGTILTHLGGGSAGREGTAVQMGGGIAGGVARLLKLNSSDTRILLMVGVAAGFGGVFGTPLAGAIFAAEVLHIGRLRYEALIPCLIGGLIGDWGCFYWGIGHTDYSVLLTSPALRNYALLIQVVIAGIVLGLAGQLFSRSSHAFQAFMRNTIESSALRPVVGSIALILLVWLVGHRDYLGLGVESPRGEAGISIVNSFHAGGVGGFSWLWKLIFTVVTIGSGFKGGEVTPLFFIGATLGNTLAILMGGPVDLFAAIGLVGLFAGATNTPIACTLMGIELFGAAHAPWFALACCMAYLFSGEQGIYSSQRIATAKRLG